MYMPSFYTQPNFFFSTGLRHALLWVAEVETNSGMVGWCAPGSRSHSSLETNGHGSVHCCPKVWLLSNWSYLRTTCIFHAALVSSQSQLTWVPNFTPSLSSPSYSTLSSFAWPASPHSVLFMYAFHIHTLLLCPCFLLPFSITDHCFCPMHSWFYYPHTVPCFQLFVSFASQLTLSHYLYPLSLPLGLLAPISMQALFSFLIPLLQTSPWKTPCFHIALPPSLW